MDKEKLIFMIKEFIRELENHRDFAYGTELGSRYVDILVNAKKLLKDNDVYLQNLINSYHLEASNRYSSGFYSLSVIKSFEYIMSLLNVMIPDVVAEKKLLEDAQDKLKEAGISFENQDFSSVINNLNTGVELALKDELDIPKTISKINTRKILDICIANDVGPKEYLQEIIKHVLEVDNKVKHQGYKPQKIDAINAVSAFEGLIKQAKKYPFKPSKEVRDKIFAGI